MTGLLATIIGVVLLLVLLRDVVSELFDPEDTGELSRAVMHGCWRIVRAIGRRRRGAILHAGAIALLSVAATWTTLLVLGFALVYWPRLPGAFLVGPDLPPSAGRGFGTALYLSLAAATTLGASEITPVTLPMRLAVAGESLLGVALITAWITWVLSIYPVLAERRAFTGEVALLRRTHPAPPALVREVPPEALAELLRSLGEQLLRVRASLGQARVTYYFQNASPELALARQLPWVLAVARETEASDGPHAAAPVLRHRGALLRAAVESVLQQIGERFLGLRGAPPEVVLAALAADHLLDAEHAPRAPSAS